MNLLVAVLTVVVVLLTVVVAGLLRSHAAILRRLHELGAGVGDPSASSSPADTAPFQTRPGVPSPPARAELGVAHDLTGTTLDGEVLATRVVGAEHDTLLAFLSSTCLTCRRFWDSMSAPDGVHLPEGVRLLVVAKDPAEESPASLAELAAPGTTLVQSSAAWASYGVPGSPYFVLVDGPTGRVRGEGTGLDWDQVLNLLGQAGADAAAMGGTSGGGARRSKAAADAAREARIDDELRAAGVHPGDPSLYRAPGPGLEDLDGT